MRRGREGRLRRRGGERAGCTHLREQPDTKVENEEKSCKVLFVGTSPPRLARSKLGKLKSCVLAGSLRIKKNTLLTNTNKNN